MSNVYEWLELSHPSQESSCIIRSTTQQESSRLRGTLSVAYDSDREIHKRTAFEQLHCLLNGLSFAPVVVTDIVALVCVPFPPISRLTGQWWFYKIG